MTEMNALGGLSSQGRQCVLLRKTMRIRFLKPN